MRLRLIPITRTEGELRYLNEQSLIYVEKCGSVVSLQKIHMSGITGRTYNEHKSYHVG